MKNSKNASGGLWVPIIIFSLLIAAIFSVILYLGGTVLIEAIGPALQADPGETTPPVWGKVLNYHSQFWYTVFPTMMGLGLLMGSISWLIVRSRVRRRLEGAPERETARVAPSDKQDAEKKELAERRMFLHLFAMLQREGRLMDFLAEDLNQYEDDQIGSAVRAVHAGCLRIVQEYLDPRPVLDQDEGGQVEIEDDFDPGAVKLTGKVVGDPPFKGILRHKGWQVGKLKLPTLSGSQNARIITPAEVEL